MVRRIPLAGHRHEQNTGSIDLLELQGKSKRPEDMQGKEEIMRVLAACGNRRYQCLIHLIHDGSHRIAEPLTLD